MRGLINSLRCKHLIWLFNALLEIYVFQKHWKKILYSICQTISLLINRASLFVFFEATLHHVKIVVRNLSVVWFLTDLVIRFVFRRMKNIIFLLAAFLLAHRSTGCSVSNGRTPCQCVCEDGLDPCLLRCSRLCTFIGRSCRRGGIGEFECFGRCFNTLNTCYDQC